jgi:hypothetical protein
MPTTGDGRQELRIYSAAEIDACLRFVKLSSSEVQWWPCLLFSNMVELQRITEQLKIWATLSQRRELTMTYMQHLPGSAMCRVALLMGEPPTPNAVLKFDINTNRDDDAFILEPFYDNVLQFGMMYSENEQYLHAVQETLPLLQQVTESLRRNKEQASSVIPSSTALKEKVSIPDISVKGSENSAPLANSTIVVSNISKPQTANSTRRNSPRQLPPEKASSKSVTNKSEDTPPLPSLLIPSSPRTTTANTKNVDFRPASSKPPPSNPPKQCELLEIPTFQEVKPSLIKGGYKFTAKSYCRPPMVLAGKDSITQHSFSTIAAFRHDLCVYGVNCQCGQMAMDEAAACACWTADEKWYIKLWVRYDVIRGSSQNPSFGPVPILSPYMAQQYLIRLGCYSRQLSSSLLTTDQVHDLFRYLSRYGLLSNNTGNDDASCDFTQLTSRELLSLEYFISSSRYCVSTL